MKSFGENLKSGIVVFLVALPLCLGIALACNVPLFSGLLAGIVGGLVVTIFSGSVLSVSGPAAGLTSIVIASVASLGSFEIFVAAVVVGGVIQVGLGIAKAGGIGNYVPSAVIKGMLAGIGIILIVKQLPHLVGFDVDPEGDFDFERAGGRNTLTDLKDMFTNMSPGPMMVGAISIVILIAGEMPFYKKSKFLTYVPSALVVVLTGAILSVFLRSYPGLAISATHLVDLPVINSFSDISHIIIRPDFSAIGTTKFWTIAVTLAVVASLESLLSIEATDKLDPHKRDSNSNKELMAQGIGNMTSGLIGGLPVTAVIVRSSANINAGATSKLSSLIHGMLLLVTVLTIPNLLMLIPNASLAAVLVFTGYKLTKLELFRQHYRRGLDQFLPFVVTISVMLLTDLLRGVGAGIAVSIYFIIRSNIRTAAETMMEDIDGKRVYLIKLPQHITFFNKGFFIRYFNNVKPHSRVIIDGSINKTTDNDVRDVMADFMETSGEREIEVHFIRYSLDN
jgi:MFS superfamily sulfate permease-like transporter